MRALRLLLAVAVVGLCSTAPVRAAAQDGDDGDATRARIVDLDFAPRDMTVASGTEVTWTNTDDRPHTVTDRGGTFDTDPIAPDAEDSITFSVPGTYSYFCRINPGRMNGTIKVTAPEGRPQPVHRIQALDPAREGEQLGFDPNTLTVAAGSTIVLANVGGKPHTLTSDEPGVFDTGVVTPGAEGGRFAGGNASVGVPRPGTFAFHCEVHPQAMTGVLTVTGQEQDAVAAVSAAPREVTVAMEGIAFDPPEISVAPGGRVTWENLDAADHNAVFDDVDIETELIGRDERVSITAPDRPGSYSYFCAPHANSMRAVLVVVGQNTGDPTATGTGAAALAAAPGPGGGVTAAALATGVVGAFLGGFGIAAFLVRRRAATPS